MRTALSGAAATASTDRSGVAVRQSEFQRLDLGAAPADLARRHQDVVDVLAGLQEVRLQLAHAIVEAAEILHQPRHLALDQVRLLAHARILEDRLNDLDRQHHQRRRDDDDARAVRLLHQRLEILVDLREHRFRRHEHEGGVLRLAGDQIFLGDVADVGLDIAPEGLCGTASALSAPSAARMAFHDSSGNLASMTSDGAPFGMRMMQSGRLLLESVAWNS